MIKIAIPAHNQLVDEHFGHCENYSVVTIDEKKQIVNRQIIPAESGCGCKSGIADTLRLQNVSVLLAGNMGQGAVEKFRIAGIEVVRGCSGPIVQLISNYLQGGIRDTGLTCAHHEHHHENRH